MPSDQLLLDSSWLIAQFDKRSRAFGEIKEFSRLYTRQFLIPQVVLTEVIYLLKRQTGLRGTTEFLQGFSDAQPNLQEVTVADLRRVKEIMQQYATANFDFVDCCIMALSERLNITQIGTLDRRDFSIFRPKHVGYLELLP